MIHLALSLISVLSIASALPTQHVQCKPFNTLFPEGTVSNINAPSFAPTPFVGISPSSSYNVDKYGGGLSLFLDKPEGVTKAKKEEGVTVNDKLSEGATINSTFTLLYGRVTFEVMAPLVPGVVTAVILISDSDSRDEIDVEILGSAPHYFSSNIFYLTPKDDASKPLYGVFGSRHPLKGDISQLHKYTFDWSEDQIVWSVDGRQVRTLRKADTIVNGAAHFPSHPARIQLGIWDASSPAGTAAWSGGPIRWDKVGQRISAIVKSVTVECPQVTLP